MTRTNRSYRRFVPCFLVLLFFALLAACAPSEPTRAQSTRKTCLDCHSKYAEQYSRGVVHQPVKEAKCNTCHRTHGQIGGVFLRQEEPELCFRCHRETSDALQTLEVIHAPVAEGQCQECHSPHNSDNDSLLVEKEESLCFKCHSREPFNGKNIHQPVAEGCHSCHAAHGSSFAGLLVSPSEELCAGCHQVDAQVFSDKHGGLPVKENCLECHSVHTSDNTFLLKKHVHEPVAGLDCRSCHKPSQEGGVALVAEGSELCLTCHEMKSSKAAVHAPVAAGDCLKCHSPHASDFTGLLATAPESLCFQCHKFDYLGPEPKRPGMGSSHSIVASGDCQSCHLPHEAAPGQVALLKAPAEKLCQECHDGVSGQKTVNHPPVQEGLCLTCHQSHESAVDGVLKQPQQKLCAGCHESVTEDMGKLSIHKPFSAGQCSTCHSPHGSSAEKLLLGPGAETCDSCHQQLATERVQEERHAPFAAGECATCHDPHASDQTTLLAGPVATLCLECHSDKQPIEVARDYHENCASCHAPHGNEGDFYLIQSLPQLCLNCHSVDVDWETGTGHQPAVDGECVVCHDPHFADKSNIVSDNWDKELCARCHDVEPANLKASHHEIVPGAQSCRTCHNPHGGPDKSMTHPIKHEPFSKGDCIVCHTGA